jgi:hypothetical protein
MRKFSPLLLALPATLLLSGCLGELMASICDFVPDADHCHQTAAVQSGQVEEC